MHARRRWLCARPHSLTEGLCRSWVASSSSKTRVSRPPRLGSSSKPLWSTEIRWLAVRVLEWIACWWPAALMPIVELPAALRPRAAGRPELRPQLFTGGGKLKRSVGIFVGEDDVRSDEGLARALAPGELMVLVAATAGG